MAIDPENAFPGKITPASPEYPFGEARNITSPGDGTGTPWDQLLVNDIFGFQQSLLSIAGLVPTGVPDEVGASQYLQGLASAAMSSSQTVATMKTRDLLPGQNLITGGYFTVGDGGAAKYRIETPGAFGRTVDELGNHTLDNGNIAVLDQPHDWYNIKQFGAKVDGDTLGTDDTASIQACIDEVNFFYLGGSTGGGGGIVYTPAGITNYTGVTIERGVSLVGAGRTSSLWSLTGVNSTGIVSPALATGLASDQLQWGSFSGMAFISGEVAPVAQIQWDMIGFSRWTVRDCFIEWFGGCTGISMVGSVLAGSGGPAQWYNELHGTFVIRAASKPAGGIAMILGDSDVGFEQVTALTMVGGRISGSGDGTGMILRGTGNSFHGVTYEGMDTAVDLGSTGTRGATANSFHGCYWEGNTINREIRANAINNSFFGSFITGGTDNDVSGKTTYVEPGRTAFPVGNSQIWDILQSFAGTRPSIKGNFAGLDLNDTVSGVIQTIRNGSATGSASDLIQVIDDPIGDFLVKWGRTNMQMKAGNLNMRNVATFGLVSGAGSPEGVVSRDPGSFYMNTSGGAGTTVYYKASGTGNTGWSAIA